MSPPTADVHSSALPSFDAAFREPASKTAAIPAVSGASYYKDPYIAGRSGYIAENELKGTEKFPAAKHQDYLPSWNPEESKAPKSPILYQCFC